MCFEKINSKLAYFCSARVEVPEVISAEQRCFRDLTFFRADSEEMKKIRGDQLNQLFRTENFSAV